jgi:type I restriction enzyme R subunit
VYALLDPALERFKALEEESRLEFKDALDKFVRTYAFVSQIVSFGDSKLERDYAYCRAVASRLRDQNTVERLDLGSEVELTHLRHDITFAGALELTADEVEIKSMTGDGRGRNTEPDVEPLSRIVDTLNERFGLNLGEADELFFEQIEESFAADDSVMAQARGNTFDNFRLVFDPKFLGTVIGRMDENEALFKRMLDDEDFQEAVKDEYAKRIFKRAREPS